jgi:AhpD family alkylhydroperoxidase
LIDKRRVRIPCSYCVFAVTQAVRAAGATEGEIKDRNR